MQSLTTCGVIIFCVRLIGAQCPVTSSGVHSYGDMCQYRCRCKDDVQCSQEKGECPSVCAQGWMGPACQYVNLAFGKNTSQSSTYNPDLGLDQYNSYAAVDGKNETCIKTFSVQKPWWSVDLGKARYIVGVQLFAPAGALDYFTIAVSNNTFKNTTNQTICYHKMKGTSANQPIHDFMCKQPVWGRYLFVYKPEGESKLEICEVQIYGGRELAFRKPTTQSTTLRFNTGAKQANDGSTADNDISFCSITQISDEPFWMVDLEKIYSIQRVVIHRRTAVEAQDQLRGFWLWIRKDRGVYGDSAYLYIHQESILNRTIEVILSKPFEGRYVELLLPSKGRQLSVCEVEVYGDCRDSTCGMDCSTQCWCNTIITGETKRSGICPYGCSDRALVNSLSCELGCDVKHWGSNCSRSCGQCASGLPCNVTTGVCASGCAVGFKTPPMCADGCVAGLYGAACNKLCGKCLNAMMCNYTTGICKNGCEAGYKYPMCTEACTNKTWGLSCSKPCGHCEQGLACDPKTGYCPDKCEKGFKEPPYCVEGCAEGYYGANCEQCGRCYNNRSCDILTGSCDSCSLGHKPPMCKSMCDNGWFGSHCSQRCGHCRNGEQCDVITGICPSGCQPGWTADNCTVVGTGEVTNSSASTVGDTYEQRKLMGIVLGTVGGILLICLIIFGYLNWVHRRRRSENIPHDKKAEVYKQNTPHEYVEKATKC